MVDIELANLFMNSNSDHNQKYADEITLDEVISAVADVIRWIKSNILGLGLSCLIATGAMLFWYAQQEDHYVAELSFMLNDDNNPQISGMAGVLSQFGIAPSGGKYNVDKLLEIARSKRIIESTLLNEVELGGKNKLLANHFIDIHELDDTWEEKRPHLKDFQLDTSKVKSTDSRFVLKSLKSKIAGTKQNRSGALLTSDYGNTDYIMSFYMKTLSDSLSILFVNELYKEVSDFFVSKSVERSQKVLNLILVERDSLAELISSTALEAARLKDRSGGSFINQNNVKSALLESKLVGYQAALQQITENLGRAEYAVKTSAPLIQPLDYPSYPLSPQQPSLLKYLMFGFAIGLVIYILIIFFIQVLRKV